MATINFLYRSKKDKAFLNLRLLFRHNGEDKVFGARTQYEVTKYYWEKQHPQRSPRDINVKNKQLEVNSELTAISSHLLEAYNKTNPEIINKEWLSQQLHVYYNPPQITDALPKGLLAYFDYYLSQRKTELAEQTIKNIKVVKQQVANYEDYLGKTIAILDFNLAFKASFEAFCVENGYSTNTISRAIRTVKSVCKHALYNGLEVSPQIDRIKLKAEKTETIYLTLDELDKIEQLNEEKLTDSLINARDWLIISCFTGQRVSDFMRFTPDQIRSEDGKKLIEFTQKKTGKVMTIPLHSKVLEILAKRAGKFPRPISSQKYNKYIKKVCEIAEINEVITGSKLTKTGEATRFPYRKESGQYMKWELVSSHIGRRSFCTNFYGKIPTSFLIYVSGHSSEKMFLNYIGKSNKDIALELTKYF